jgi:hypothetical protein
MRRSSRAVLPLAESRRMHHRQLRRDRQRVKDELMGVEVRPLTGEEACPSSVDGTGIGFCLSFLRNRAAVVVLVGSAGDDGAMVIGD